MLKHRLMLVVWPLIASLILDGCAATVDRRAGAQAPQWIGTWCASHKIIVATLTLFGAATYFSEEGEVKRQAVNRWIRSTHEHDAVIDFDAATRDPLKPKQLRAAFDSGDHLHPNDAGYEAMANSIDLKVFGL